jgi:hypothetical protein
MPAVLVGSLLGGPTAARHVTQPHHARGCVLWILCWPSPSPSPAQSQAPLPAPTLPGLPALPVPGASPAPDPGPPGTSTPAKVAQADPGFAASTAVSVITAGSATLNGLAYQGTAKVPVNGGTQTMMKFTLNSMTLSGGVTATVTENGQTTITRNSTLAFSGGVTLYATKLSGDLLGIPVTLTPSSVVSLLLQVLKTLTPLVPVTLTNVTTDQPLVLAGALQADNLVVTNQ